MGDSAIPEADIEEESDRKESSRPNESDRILIGKKKKKKKRVKKIKKKKKTKSIKIEPVKESSTKKIN